MALPHSADCAWFLGEGASLGEEGTAAAMVNVLRYGIQPSRGMPSENTPSDRMLGWGEPPRPEGEIARARRCWAVWRRLSHRSQCILLARYSSRPWPPGVAGSLGELAGVVVVLVGSSHARKRILEATERLHECAGLPWTPAMAEVQSSAQPCLIPSDWEPVIRACQSTSRDAIRTREKWIKEAQKALEEATDEWATLAQSRAELGMAA